MSKLFLADIGIIEVSYEKLLNDVNLSEDYCPILRASSLYDFFLNFIIGLSSNNPLTMIDSDLSDGELSDFVLLNSVNKLKTIQKKQFLSIEELANTVCNSSSEITVFTSGTTGQPKKVIHSTKSLCRNIRQSDKYKQNIWGYAYNSTHMAGLQVFFQAFANLNTLVNIFRKTRKEIYHELDEYTITNISATPTFYRMLLPFDREFTKVERLTLGGEKTMQKLIDNLIVIFPNAKINNIYASTEAGTLFSAHGEDFQIPDILKDKILFKEGELLIHSSLLGKSDSFIFENEYYNTSDMVEWIDEPNLIFRFKGRKNELINVGGFKVNPSEIEDVINQIPEVECSRVFGKPNSVLGNILCAEIKLVGRISESEIRFYMHDKLQDYKIPRKINFVDDFQLTRTGKIKR